MKLCKLKLRNLNSFRRKVELNFEESPLDDASLVAITGPTGAGKTTLLDAVCVALYGKTPRLGKTGSQNPRYLLSHGEDEGSAEVHFEANGTRYLATWSITRKGSPKGQLISAEDGGLISNKLSTRGKSLGSSQNTVGEEVTAILGLDFGAFSRSVMLAQGEFAAFLKASNEERRTILEATAGIYIYDVLRQVLHDKVKEVTAANDEVLAKLNKIPEASREQLTDAKSGLDRLQKEAGEFAAQSQQVQQERARETKRKEDFARLQSSEERQKELSDRQSEIDNLEEERERARRADSLRPEKQAFGTAKLELEKAEKARRVATTEKTDAEKQAETNQAVFDEKAAAHQATSVKHSRKAELYTAAKLDVGRAADQLAAADKRTPDLADLGKEIEGLSNQLDARLTEQAGLRKQIEDAQRFLDENPLPSERQHRLNRATGLLAELGSQQNQLAEKSASKVQHQGKVSSLKREIKKLSNTREKRLSEKADAEAALETAADKLNTLLADGTREKWDIQKQRALEVQLSAQRYETVENNLAGSEDRLRELNMTKAALDTKLERVETELANQVEVCQSAVEEVQRCQEAREAALLANPINQLRQHLHAGEPCLVCGAKEHPYADVVEPEGEELLQNAENALADAKVVAQAAQDRMQALNTRQAQTEQNKRNTAAQIEECTVEIAALRDEAAQLLAEWHAMYPNADVSSDWTAGQIEEADTAIAKLGEADQTHTQASHVCQTAVQQLKICDNNIAHETKLLEEFEGQLQNVSNTVAGLRVDIASTESRFWQLLPDVFRGVTPKEAVAQFDNKIKKVEAREDERRNAKTQLELLDTKIRADGDKLENLKKSRKGLQAEIDKYRCEGEAFLNAVRDNTSGLETEAGIDAAIDELEAELQTKENTRDEAEQQLQKIRDLFTRKQTAYAFCDKRHAESSEKFEAAHQTYANKLNEVGFDSSEVHDDAFRDEAQLQEITARIDAHKNEKQALKLVLTELRTRFEETPFDSDALGEIEAQAQEIEAQFQAKHAEIGAQGERIKGLKDALEKREALGNEMSAAEQELERWKRLQETIPTNALRDFALEIMFKQMGALANEQLRYLTSERYQLKVESIGNLTVIDRWNANEERPVETLSGGESFLTSLALALALAELSRGRAQLNSLFLDEGFGTLDTETLDIAIAALEGLRMQGRSIFVISHIQELTRRLPVKINVKKQGNGSSSIEIRG